MRLKKILEKKGFRDLIVKSVVFVSVVFVGLLALMQILASQPAKAGHLPKGLKPFSFLQIGEAMLFVPALFVVYNRAKLYSADAYGVGISGFCQ